MLVSQSAQGMTGDRLCVYQRDSIKCLWNLKYIHRQENKVGTDAIGYQTLISTKVARLRNERKHLVKMAKVKEDMKQYVARGPLQKTTYFFQPQVFDRLIL